MYMQTSHYCPTSCSNTHTYVHYLEHKLTFFLTFHFYRLPTVTPLAVRHHTVNTYCTFDESCILIGSQGKCFASAVKCVVCQLCHLENQAKDCEWVVSRKKKIHCYYKRYADCVSRDDAWDKILLRDSSWSEIYSILSCLLQSGISFTAQ